MSHDTQKRDSGQAKISRSQQIAYEQNQWHQDVAQLHKERTDLGHGDLTQEAFLALVPDDADMAKQSCIIALQERYKALTEQQGLLWAEDTVVKEFNKKHAVVHTGQTFILTEKNNTSGGVEFSLESKASFKLWNENKNIRCADGVERNKADIWLRSPERRDFCGIVFDPAKVGHKDGYYNLWKGFAREAKPGDSSLFWDHVRHNICGGDQERYWYVRRWVASVFQRPDQIHTALVLCGSQGVGKNSFVDPLGVLLGIHFAPLSNISELVSNFNYHLKDAVLIHANEALWGGNKKDLGTVKSMITDKKFLIEGKGKDRIPMQNFRHVILSSNEDWPVHLDSDDRRFYVIRVSEGCKENVPYFGAIQEQLDNGGYEALLYDLLHEDLTEFKPRIMPASADAFSIKIRSADSTHRYLYEVLLEGGFSIGMISSDRTPSSVGKSNTSGDKLGDLSGDNPVWQSAIPKEQVYGDYAAWCNSNGELSVSHTLFGKAIKKVLVSVMDTRPATGQGHRIRCYTFPTLEQTRGEFCKAFKEDPKRIFDTDDDL